MNNLEPARGAELASRKRSPPPEQAQTQPQRRPTSASLPQANHQSHQSHQHTGHAAQHSSGTSPATTSTNVTPNGHQNHQSNHQNHTAVTAISMSPAADAHAALLPQQPNGGGSGGLGAAIRERTNPIHVVFIVIRILILFAGLAGLALVAWYLFVCSAATLSIIIVPLLTLLSSSLVLCCRHFETRNTPLWAIICGWLVIVVILTTFGFLVLAFNNGIQPKLEEELLHLLNESFDHNQTVNKLQAKELFANVEMNFKHKLSVFSKTMVDRGRTLVIYIFSIATFLLVASVSAGALLCVCTEGKVVGIVQVFSYLSERTRRQYFGGGRGSKGTHATDARHSLNLGPTRPPPPGKSHGTQE